MKSSWSFKRMSLLTLIGVLLVSTWTVKPSQGAVPQLDSIRVAIFLQFPGKYQVNTGAATLSSPGGLSIGMRDPDGAEEWIQVGASTQARFAKDDYKVKVVETTSFDTALSVYKRLQALSGSGFITSLTKKGKTVYQVTEGTYDTAALATTALAKWSADSEIKKLTSSAKQELQGPLHLETGSYSTKAEADKASAVFQAAGVDTFVAIRKADGAAAKPRYSVMVGAASTSAELEVVKLAAGADGSSLKSAVSSSSYMLLRNDHTVTAKAASSLTMYTFPVNDSKVWVAPASSDTIQLTERYNRTYRGAFEISEFNGMLAVVNELPFEQYLYSVVGGEMSASWPIEALKAQAVAARTYALYQGFGYQIAHVVDSVNSQVYGGTGAEKPSTIEAVDATAGEVILYNGKLIEALFSSSTGGVSADATEIWGNAVAYLKSVASPDSSSEKGLYSWYRVALASGLTGYIREDLLNETSSKNGAGLAIMEVNTNGSKVRKMPIVDDTVALIGQLDKGAKVAILEKVVQNNQMSWVRGPYTSAELIASMKGQTTSTVAGPITSLEVSKQGPSGRVIEMKVNGNVLPVKYPVNLRPALGGLPSTLFTVDETAKVTMRGAGSSSRTKPSDTAAVYVLGAGGTVKQADSSLFIMNKDGKVRASTKEVSYRFIGTGNGHGVGLSQYGALSLAQQGYDYSYILQYYYKDVTIAKE